MNQKMYLNDYEYDLMSDVELDCLDCDYQYQQYLNSKEEAKERLARYSFNEKISRCGMTYGQIEELNNKMFELEWNS